MRSLTLILTNRLYFGASWVFASLNILIGTWAIYIPTVAEKLGLGEGALGVSLFFFALGTLISIPMAPLIIKQLGVGRVTIVSVVFFCVAAVFPLLASSHFLLSLALFMVGATSGVTDIAMNTLVSEIESVKKVKIMSAAHGFFSLGGVIGAGIGSLLIAAIASPWIHMAMVAGVTLVVNLLLARYYINWRSATKEKTSFSFRSMRPLFALGLISFIMMASEGAVVDWSGLYLEKVTMAGSALLIGMGYTVFSVTMTLGRFLGDQISHRLGSYPIIITGLILGATAYLVILTGNTMAAIIGFGILGLGFSVIIPELFRLGGNVSEMSAARGISFIAGTGYAGFLTGPVVLGFLAQWSSLKTSYILLLGAALFALVIAWYSRKQGNR
ncbi:MFS transporter [Robertkochia marina]|uniref:MFS transporter n=1 Tax=Robertkochia marina TaxID=1227945 RepID=A0A4S3LXQ2_9FLAO|nr:MFS transporter [Robertkochia marina]THD66338.1 MFS transporter [Robertkochia marina]TRZ44021.1 MFS transporter [Robertkochia marina]